jgi:hypothetical protein
LGIFESALRTLGNFALRIGFQGHARISAISQILSEPLFKGGAVNSLQSGLCCKKAGAVANSQLPGNRREITPLGCDKLAKADFQVVCD